MILVYNATCMKRERKGPISLKRMITIILVIQTVVFFFMSFFLLWGRQLYGVKQQTKYALQAVEKFLPQLSDNETYALERYELFYSTRGFFLGRRIYQGHITNQEEFEETAEALGFTGAYLTDEKGRIIFSYGEEPHTDLPYQDGWATEDDEWGTIYYSGISEDQPYMIYGISLGDGRYLTTETANEAFYQFLSQTFTLNEQLRVLSMCCDVNVFVYDQTDSTVLSHENVDYEGAKMQTVPVDADLSLFKLDSISSPMYIGCTYDVGDWVIAVTVPLMETLLSAIAYALQFTLMVSVVTALVGGYIYYAVQKGELTKKEFHQNTVALSVLGLAFVFSFSWFWQALVKETNTYLNLAELLHGNATAQSIYEAESDEIEDWLAEQYLIQCRIAAQEVADHYDEITTEDLQELSEALDLEYIYVVNQKGEVILTDSPYNHFVLKEDGEQSAAFRALLDGVDHVTQEAMKDDVSGEERQYMGVSIRNADGDADGCVLISLDPMRIDDLQSMISVERTLRYGLIGETDFACVVDGETDEIYAATDPELIGYTVQDLGLTEEMLQSQKLQKTRFDDRPAIVGDILLEEGNMDGDYLVMGMYQDKPANAVVGSLIFAAYTFLMLLILWVIGNRHYCERIPDEEEAEKEDAPEDEEAKAMEEMVEDERGFFVFSKLAKNNEKYQFEERWSTEAKKEEEMTTAELTLHSIRGYAIAYGIVFLVPLLLYLLGVQTPFGRVLGFVVNGNWEKGIGIFTAAQCILMICVMVLLDKIIKRLLYYIARLSPYRVETVCLMLRSSIKYIFALIVIIYILLKLGVNPTALLASAGVLSMVIGFGAQKITADILAGFFIIFERAFDVGDFIKIDDTFGIVTEIGLRTTKIRWYADITVINNSEIRKVINQSGDVMRMIVPVRVRYEEKLEDLEALIAEALPEIGERIVGLVQPPAYQGINRFAENGIDLRFALYSVGYQRMWVQRQFLREMKLFLEKNNIEVPYQLVELHEGKTKSK